MKKRMILFVLSLALIIGMLSAGNAYAWFSTLEGGSAVANNVQSGKVIYSFGSTDFIAASGEIFPEQRLMSSTLTLINSSNVPTKLRARISYTVGSESGYWTSNEGCPLQVSLSTGWSVSGDYLVYSGNVPPSVNLIEQMWISGENTDDSIAGQNFTVLVHFDAEQSQYKDNWG